MTNWRDWFHDRRGRSITLLLLVGLAIREAFSFWTGHPYDLEVWIRTGYVVGHGTNPYLQAWPAVPGLSFGYTSQPLYAAAYLPFWPDVFGGSYVLWQHVGGGNRFALYFLLKQGPIAGDLLIAILLHRIVLRRTGDQAAAMAALTFWTFFPYTIVISAIWGQLDAVTTAIVLAALLTSEIQARERNLLWGLGIFVKWITVVFLPLEFFRARGWRRLWPIAGVGLTGALTLIAFVAARWSFTGILATTTSSTGGGGGGMNYVQLVNLWFLSGLFLAHPWIYPLLSHLWIPAAVVAGWFAARWARTGQLDQEVRALLLVVTVLLVLRWGLYEQYMLYPFALLALDVYTRHPERRSFFYFLVALAVTFLLVNDVLGIWFASPASAGAFNVVQAFDSSSVGGAVRYYLLDAIAIGMTITLVQLIVVLGKDDPSPWPWLLPRIPRGPSPALSGPDVPAEVAAGP